VKQFNEIELDIVKYTPKLIVKGISK